MEGDGNEVLPEAGRIFEPAQPVFGRWTTAAAFRGVELE